MKTHFFVSTLCGCLSLLLLAGNTPAVAQNPAPAQQAAAKGKQDPKARALLDQAKAKVKGLKTLIVDCETLGGWQNATKNFKKAGEIFMERPNRFRVEKVAGVMGQKRGLVSVSDGRTITTFHDASQFVAYEKPLHENFYEGQHFIVQFFFDPDAFRFDPNDSTWGRPMSQFDRNVSAYDRDTSLTLVGERTLEGMHFKVVEIKYNTYNNDIRQQIYVGDDLFVYQVDTYADGAITATQKYRNFRPGTALPAKTWSKDNPANKPIVAIDPARMGQPTQNFVLPGHNGGEFALDQLLAGKKALYVCVLNGTDGLDAGNADVHLPQMRMLQEMKDKFEKQGLAVVAIVGGPRIKPDVKDEMLLNWMPDLTRFNYPVLIDLDIERGLQGNAFYNFQVNGRNNVLMDSKKRVVFASNNFREKVNQLAFYQALAQLGFAVSPADLESAGGAQ